MTRINIIPVQCLTDKHLLAEYKEITRPFNKVVKRIEKYGEENALDDVTIPDKYTLGKGHESFFFDKLRWLWYRYNQLREELTDRNFNIDEKQFQDILGILCDKLWHTKYWNNYKPTPEELYLNMARLAKRSKLENVLEELNDA